MPIANEYCYQQKKLVTTLLQLEESFLFNYRNEDISMLKKEEK